jgi:hypothetical protein
VKAHIERRDRSGKALCGASMPEDFNPWTTHLETCERCSKIDYKRREEGAAKAARIFAAARPETNAPVPKRDDSDIDPAILDALIEPMEYSEGDPRGKDPLHPKTR